MHECMDIHPEVALALENNQPVVALETGMFSHGFPWPDNLEIFNLLEQTIHDQGAQAAPVAILGGRIKVGLSRQEKEWICQPGQDTIKASRRTSPAWSPPVKMVAPPQPVP